MTCGAPCARAELIEPPSSRAAAVMTETMVFILLSFCLHGSGEECRPGRFSAPFPGWVIFDLPSEMARAGHSTQKTAPRRLCHGGGARRDAELAQDVRHVAVHGVLADVEAQGDVRRREIGGDEAQDLDLALGESGVGGEVRPRDRLRREALE